jgi:hypothetical protein
LSITSRKINNYTEVTHHFHSTIHQQLSLNKIKPPKYVYKEPSSASFELDKESILTLLASKSIRYR